MEAKFTPGPWNADIVNDDGAWIRAKGGALAVARVGWGGRERSIVEANARLIAAAPEMLEALELIFSLYDDSKSCGELASLLYEARCIARNPIAKALGSEA